MQSYQPLLPLMGLSFILALPTSYAADEPAPISRASLLTQPCFSCHGAQGVSKGVPIPSLTGLSADKLYEQLVAFKTGQRPATLMNRIAKGYSDEELKLIADYLANSKPTAQ